MKKNNKIIRNILIIVAIFLTALFFIFLYWKNNFYAKTGPNTFINDINISSKSKNEVEDIIKEYIYEIENNGILFTKNDSSSILKIGSDSIDSGPSYPFILIDVEKSTNNFFDETDNKSFAKFFINILFKNKETKDNYIVYDIDKEIIKIFLQESFSNLIIPYENAYYFINNENELEIQAEKIGKDINYENVFEQLNNNIINLKNNNIIISTHSVYPEFKIADLQLIENDVRNILNKGNSLKLIFSENSDDDLKNLEFTIPSKTLISWLGVKNEKNNINTYLDDQKIINYLEDNISSKVNKEIVLPKFEMDNEKVTNWQTGKDGRELDIEQSVINIKNGFLNEDNLINLATKVLSVNKFSSENDFKIEEIIGTGHSNFSGSSANRIQNIRNGSNFLHGLLIKPGEEFSLISNLGEIDAENGYLPELVIKDGKTIPEYGGGLCQVGTTMFRTALQSGLPITMRRNHSYRVSYYEPAGTDATIYDPWPDFKFINDTGNYILIQYRMEGNNLYYDFWGVKDGREVTVTDPVIYNIVKPPATKMIETDELKPGEKRCTESAHNGADAYFDYKVIYPEGSTTTPIVETRFHSHYVPWQAVCLIGKEENKEEEIKEKDDLITEEKNDEDNNEIVESE